MNEAELEHWRRDFVRRGQRVVSCPKDADVCIVNTCAVTGEAGRQSRQAVRRLHRRNPQAHLVFAGCDATLEPDRAQGIIGVDMVVPNEDKETLVEQVIAAFAERTSLPVAAQEGETRYTFSPSRTRAFLKVQDGCNNHCTFCIVSTLRGAERSRPPMDVVREVRHLVALGYREVVLTGVHLGGYGKDLGTDLKHLVTTLLEETSVERLRLSSLEPWNISSDFFELWDESHGRLMPHLHLPLQSGCDATLRRMGRHYTTADYARLVEEARRRISDLTLTTDVIVGFPGETEEEFATSLRFIEQMHFAHIHIFTYSPREGTAAIRLPAHVPPTVKKARSKELHRLMWQSKIVHMSHYIGKVRPVLWEEAKEQADSVGRRVWSGWTDNYMRVRALQPATVNLQNAIIPTRLVQVMSEEGGYFVGEPVWEQASWPAKSLQGRSHLVSFPQDIQGLVLSEGTRRRL